uniref:Flagellar associated protein n=1 Tax=Tetraselmis sp. GSL018 TaxID=582737 RepID=A0A061RIW9_9CHLO
MNTYALRGVSGEPVAESHIALECRARETTLCKVPVPNRSKQAHSFSVYSDLSFVSGKELVQVEAGKSKEYKMNLHPPKSGKFTGSITFASEGDFYVWHTLELTVLEAAPVDHIEVSAEVRKAVSIAVAVETRCRSPRRLTSPTRAPASSGCRR